MSAPNSLVKRFTVAKPNHKGEENIMKTRKQIIDECVSAATACFNYYSDFKLSNEARLEIGRVLDSNVPDRIPTVIWQAYSDNYQDCVDSPDSSDNASS